MTIKEMRIAAKLTQQKLSDWLEIPKRTIEDWEAGKRNCPTLKRKYIIEKLEEMIMMNAKETLKKAREMDEFKNDLPEVEVGDVVNLETIWDGEGSAPEESYSYQLTDIDWINYKFEIIETNEDETLVKIIDIELL